jgi:hypothetical protein
MHADIHDGPELSSNQRSDTLMQDRSPPARQSLLATHGRTIHSGHSRLGRAGSASSHVRSARKRSIIVSGPHVAKGQSVQTAQGGLFICARGFSLSCSLPMMAASFHPLIDRVYARIYRPRQPSLLPHNYPQAWRVALIARQGGVIYRGRPCARIRSVRRRAESFCNKNEPAGSGIGAPTRRPYSLSLLVADRP